MSRDRSMLLGLLLLMVCSAQAQGIGMDTPSGKERKAAFKVLFNVDARRTFVDAVPVRFYGFRIGAQRGRDVIAVGFYGLGDPFVRKAIDLPELGVRDLETRFDYAGFVYERILLDSKRWEIGVPLSIGLGNYRTSYRDTTEGLPLRTYRTNELVPMEAGVTVDYDLFWWAFIGVGGGYRYVLAEEPVVTVALSDLTYYVKFGLRFGEVVKRTRQALRKDHGTK